MHVKTNSTKRLFSPAKVNLLLAVTGKREDGFHDLISLVAPLSFGDFLTVSCSDGPGQVEFSCTDPDVPLGRENLVVRAAEAYLQAIGRDQGLQIHLEKHIPMEAGLGGGSSNAATSLLALNELFGEALGRDALSELAATLGSDCPLFLHRAPVIMRGRGEKIETLAVETTGSLEGQLIAVFKPNTGISTVWAYGSLMDHGNCYSEPMEVESKIKAWKGGELPLEELLYNTFEIPVFEKFVAFPALFEQIRSELGLRPLMSGSGSSCFVALPEPASGQALEAIIKEAFGKSAFYKICRIGTNQ